MTSSLLDVRLGRQTPRLSSGPTPTSTAGDDAIDLADRAGLVLDEWQQLVLRRSLGERQAGGKTKWMTSDVGLVVSRQNGKNAILEARELAGLFLFGERVLIHTAHEMKAAAVTFRRIVQLVNGQKFLLRRVKNISYSKGEEGIELHDGARLRFMARTGGSGRAFSADFLALDEAYNLPEHVMSALTPTLAARPNPQTWYTSSAVNAVEHPHGLTLARVRRRALSGSDPRLAYAEWSGDDVAYAAMTPAQQREYVLNRDVWAMANPGLGIRIQEEFLEDQARRLGVRGFAAEHLSIGEWPEEPSTDPVYVVDPVLWEELVDRLSRANDPVAFGVHVAPDRSAASISAAGWRPDGLAHLEVIAQHRGVAWLLDKVIDLNKHRPCAIMLDPASPAGSLVTPLEQAGIDVHTVTAREYGQACGEFRADAVERTDERPLGALRHQDDVRLTTALEHAPTRPLMGLWVWDEKNATVDLTPLVAVTLALHGLKTYGNEGTVNLW